MFDLAWSEIMLIGAVALVVIGPKELPGAIRTISQMLRKAREMAWEFRGHVDEMVREANLDEVRNQINEIRNFDVKGEVAKAVDPDGSLRRTVEEAGRDIQDAARGVEDSVRSGTADTAPPSEAAAPAASEPSDVVAVTADAAPPPPDASSPDVARDPVAATDAPDEPPPFVPPGTTRT